MTGGLRAHFTVCERSASALHDSCSAGQELQRANAAVHVEVAQVEHELHDLVAQFVRPTCGGLGARCRRRARGKFEPEWISG